MIKVGDKLVAKTDFEITENMDLSAMNGYVYSEGDVIELLWLFRLKR